MAREEVYQRHIDLVKDFLSEKELCDFTKYAVANLGGSSKKMSEWIEFVKKYFSKEEYEDFVIRVLPFEIGTNEENEELKEEVASMALRVFQYKAGLIDIIDEITPNIHKYMYMVKQLRFTYKKIAGHVFNHNIEFYKKIRLYKNTTIDTMEFADITDEERNKVKQLLIDRNLPKNDITYYEAYQYADRKGLIKKNKRNSGR